MSVGENSEQDKRLLERKQALLQKWLAGNSKAEEILPRNTSDIFPLSFAQQRLWFLEQLLPNSPQHNVAYGITIRGKLDFSALEKALNEIIRRHESLRTEFIVLANTPMQKVVTIDNYSINKISFINLPTHEKEKAALDYIANQTQTNINITKAPLLRAYIIALDQNTNIFFILFQHLICDGWSLSLFQYELMVLYKKFAHGETVQLKELNVQYGDFSEWQREKVNSLKYQNQLAYWEKQLHEVNTDLLLQFDMPKKTIETYQGRRHVFSIDANITAKLKEIVKTSKSTLYIVLLSALNVLIYKYSQQEEMTVGCPIANRNHSQIENIIGFFVNTLVIRNKINPAASFYHLLEETKKVVFQAYENQDIPFELVVKKLQPNRDTSMSPLFKLGFVLQNTPMVKRMVDELDIQPLHIFNGISQINLLLSLTEIDNQLSGFFEYSTELFKDETIRYFTNHYLTLLKSICDASIDTSIEKLNIISAKEKQAIMSLFDIKKQYLIADTIHQRFEKVVDQFPHAIAIVFEEQQISYQELNRRINQLAHYLHAKKQIKTGSFVGVYMDRSVDIIIAILAVLKIGGAYVPLDVTWPKNRIDYICSDVNLNLLLTQSYLHENIPSHIPYLDVNANPIISNSVNVHNLLLPIFPDDLAYIIYTSGSTGLPKGVEIEHKNVLRLFDSTHDVFHFTPQDVWTLFHSCAFDFSVWEIFGALLYGGKLIIIPYIISRSPKDFYQTVCTLGVTMLSQTPSAFKQLLHVCQNETATHHLRYIFFGGEKLDPVWLQPWFDSKLNHKTRLINMYGITETTVHVTYHEITPQALAIQQSIIGEPLNDLAIYLLDNNFQTVPFNIPGEIYVGGAGVARGYHNKPELTDYAFINNPINHQTIDKLYKTGDIAKINSAGELIYLGRHDHQVKIRGFRIELGEIENAIKTHKNIQDAFMQARDDAAGNKYLVAYYVSSNQVNQPNITCQQWSTVFDQIYSDQSYAKEFNIVGWNSLYTGNPISEIEMHDWLDKTIAQLLALNPKKILEIGCGTGLILFKMINHCEYYAGFDISLAAIQQLKEYFLHNEKIVLKQQAANDFSNIPENVYDTVILNSVIQYFPNIEYLLQVIENIIEIMPPDGNIFIGDIRNLTLQKMFYQDVEQFRASEQLSVEELDIKVKERLHDEHELLIDPQFFYALKNKFPQISHVEVKLKKGEFNNELTRFRYDVIIKIGKQENSEDVTEVNFCETHNFGTITSLIDDKHPIALLLKNVPNFRLSKYTNNKTHLAAAQLRLLEKEYNYQHEFFWPSSNESQMMDILLYKTDLPFLHANPRFTENEINLHNYANEPKVEKYHSIENDLRTYLLNQLPNYMIPAFFIRVDKFSLTANGKIDTRVLPAPNKDRPDLKIVYVAPTTPLQKQLAEIWCGLLSINNIGIHDSFFDLGGHSLLATQLIFRLQEQLNIEVPLRQLFEVPTIAWLEKSIEAIRTGAEEDLKRTFNFHQEAIIDLPIRRMVLNHDHQFSANHILLTGATGFFGAFILRTLLQETHANISCLVRAGDKEEGLQRIANNLNYYGISANLLRERVSVYIGDLAESQFGLQQLEYDFLLHNIDVIYHNGGLVNFISPYIYHKGANVFGTQQILKMCNEGKHKLLHYVSTSHVFTPADSVGGFLYEDKLPAHPHELVMGYTQSKWVAEKMISSAAQQGMPAYIYRIGRIWGDSSTGHCQQNDFLWLIIKTCIRLRLAPKLNFTIDCIPANLASMAIYELSKLQLSNSRHPFGKAFHIVHPQPITWNDLISMFNKLGYSLEISSYEHWYKTLINYAQANQNAEINTVIGLINKDWEGYLAQEIKIHQGETLNALTRAGWVCPEFNMELMDIYLKYFYSNEPLKKYAANTIK